MTTTTSRSVLASGLAALRIASILFNAAPAVKPAVVAGSTGITGGTESRAEAQAGESRVSQ